VTGEKPLLFLGMSGDRKTPLPDQQEDATTRLLMLALAASAITFFQLCLKITVTVKGIISVVG
jgi:hypothetical protein